MKLDKKRLASRALHVGKDRIVFNHERLAEIKEAITKQDIRDLAKDGAIFVRDPAGRKKHVVSRQRRRAGSIKKKVDSSKREYMLFVRAARRHIAHMRGQGSLTREQAHLLKQQIRARRITTKAALREHTRGASTT